MRVYLGVTLAALTELRCESRIRVDSAVVQLHAVTSAQRNSQEFDEEESELEAMLDAAFASAVLGGSDATAAATSIRAIVITADLEADAVTETGPGSIVQPAGPTVISLRSVLSVHVSEKSVAPETDETEPDLLWFDRTELAAALDQAGRR